MLRRLVIAFLAASLFAGCSTLESSSAVKRKEALKTKIAQYKALVEAIDSQTLRNGISPAQIREKFGEPDDIFSSGTSTGRFEIWTYESALDDAIKNPRPIRLYFNNFKLVSWNY